MFLCRPYKSRSTQRHVMSSSDSKNLQATLHRVCTYLEAPRYDTGIADPKTLSMMKTYTANIENVFGRYYEWKQDIADYEWIPVGYEADWASFINGLVDAIKGKKRFNGICSVLYLRVSTDATGYVIEDFSIRPCAVGHGFFEEAVSQIMTNMEHNRPLNITAFTVKKIFVDKLKATLKLSDEETNVSAKNRFLSDSTKQHTYTFTPSGPKQTPTFYPPNAAVVNSFSDTASEKNKTWLEVMDGHTSTASWILNNLKDEHSTVTSVMDIGKSDREDLLVYKGGYVYKFKTKTPV